MYTFEVPENAATGTTVGRIMAEDGDVGSNARVTYSLEDELGESSTFIIQTDPVTQEGVVLLAKVVALKLADNSSFSYSLVYFFDLKPLHIPGGFFLFVTAGFIVDE